MEELKEELFPWTCVMSGEITYKAWLELVTSSFPEKYLITEEDVEKHPRVAHFGGIRDVYGCSVAEEEVAFRCNYPVALGMARGILPKEVAKRALDIAYEKLVCESGQIGIKTLIPSHELYRPNYDNANDSDDFSVAFGWNYHQGPEWIWPLGFWFQVRQVCLIVCIASIIRHAMLVTTTQIGGLLCIV